MAFPDYAYDYYEDFEDALGGDWTETDPEGVLDPQSTNAEYRGSQGVKYNWSGGNTASLVFDLPSGAVAALSMGVWYKTPANDNAKVTIGIMDHSSNFIFRIYNYPTYLRLRNDSGTWSDTNITVSANTWYWLTMKAVKGDTCTLRAYDTNHDQVGDDITVAGDNNDIEELTLFGDAEDVETVIYMDEVVMDKTDATFPLLGWESAPAGIVVLRRRRM